MAWFYLKNFHFIPFKLIEILFKYQNSCFISIPLKRSIALKTYPTNLKCNSNFKINIKTNTDQEIFAKQQKISK